MVTVKQYQESGIELECERHEFDTEQEALAFIAEETKRDEERRDNSVVYYTVTLPVEKRVIKRIEFYLE